MFVDEVVMNVEAGSGGNGCLAYRRESYVPMGGPFGGSGGKGADIIFKADSGLKTLIDLRYQKKIRANNGENGLGKGMNGRPSPQCSPLPACRAIRQYHLQSRRYRRYPRHSSPTATLSR